jgi:hypothetical protein
MKGSIYYGKGNQRISRVLLQCEMQEIGAANLQETTRKIKLLRAKLNRMKREINEIKEIVTDLELLA